MPQGPRTERVGEGFREILAEAIHKLKDPRIGFVTITGVKVVPELRFEEDDALATGERIDRIIDRLHHEEGASHDA